MAKRAKFRCTRRAECTDGGHAKNVTTVLVTMQAVYGEGEGDPNREWSKWTPTGQLEMSITNPDAFMQFEIGKSYYLDITPAEG